MRDGGPRKRQPGRKHPGSGDGSRADGQVRHTVGASRAPALEPLGDPTAFSRAQARPTSMADQRLTDCVHEAPDFSGSNGALTLLSFFLLHCLLFPKTKAEENTEPPDSLPPGKWHMGESLEGP